MNPEQLAEIEARLHEHGHLDRADAQALISAVRHTPSVSQMVEMLNEAGREFDRIILATNPQTGSHPIRFTVGGMTRKEEAVETMGRY